MVYKNTIAFTTDAKTESRIRTLLKKDIYRSKSHLIDTLVNIGLNEVEKNEHN